MLFLFNANFVINLEYKCINTTLTKKIINLNLIFILHIYAKVYRLKSNEDKNVVLIIQENIYVDSKECISICFIYIVYKHSRTISN